MNTPQGRKSIKNPLQSFTFPIDVASGSAGNLQVGFRARLPVGPPSRKRGMACCTGVWRHTAYGSSVNGSNLSLSGLTTPSLQARNGRSGDSPSLTGNPTLRHPDVNLQQQYDRLQNDLKSEVGF